MKIKTREYLIEEKEDLEVNIHTVHMLLSLRDGIGLEVGKLEDLIRALPNVTVARSKQTIRRGGRMFVEMVIKVNSVYFYHRTPNEYVKQVLISSFNKNMPGDYKAGIVDWSLLAQNKENT